MPESSSTRDLQTDGHQPEAYLADLQLALVWLRGREAIGNDGVCRTEYLSPRTSPTEQQAREAYARAVLALIKRLTPTEDLEADVAGVALLVELAESGNPATPPRPGYFATRRKMEFRKSQGHTDVRTDFQIAWEVNERIEADGRKTEAYIAVAKRYLLSPGQVEKICRKARPAVAAGLAMRDFVREINTSSEK